MNATTNGTDPSREVDDVGDWDIHNSAATHGSGGKCSHGIILPLTDESAWNVGTRAFLYLVGLLYCFIGVAIVADVFMESIERITSKTKKVGPL